MIYFIVFLRFLAAILITNSHYQNIYPLEIIASGGLLGDVLFFSISGYLVGKSKRSFPNWYAKRVIRIYPSIIIITSIFLVIGAYSINTFNLFEYFVFPTNYHFIASIMILYIPMYFISKYVNSTKTLGFIILLTLFGQVMVYLLFYDYSYYHIDNVREPMIRFLFFISMLIGYYYNINHQTVTKGFKITDVILVVLIAVVYFITKMIFVTYDHLSFYQIINQYSLLLLLFLIFRTFSRLEEVFKRIPKKAFDVINLISKLTLEIYLVQYVIIPTFENLFFPLNFIVVTVSIFLSAYILYKLTKFVESKFIKILRLNG